MLTNKWIIVALGAALTLLGYFGTVDWTTLAPTKAGAIISAIGVLKIIIGAIMPPSGQTTITSTGGSVITHTCLAILGGALGALFVSGLLSATPAMALGRAPVMVLATAQFVLPLAGLALAAAAVIAVALLARRAWRFAPAMIGMIAVAPLAGCAGGQLTPQAQADIQTALDAICPTATALRPSVVATFNGNVRTAYNAVLMACPPNPPPTNPIVIGIDIFEAIQIAAPYVKAATAKH